MKKAKPITLPKHIIKQLEKKRAIIAQERDALRDAMDEIEGLVESCNSGLECLDQAIDDHFSEQA